jgi:hypothetical protein
MEMMIIKWRRRRWCQRESIGNGDDGYGKNQMTMATTRMKLRQQELKRFWTAIIKINTNLIKD